MSSSYSKGLAAGVRTCGDTRYLEYHLVQHQFTFSTSKTTTTIGTLVWMWIMRALTSQSSKCFINSKSAFEVTCRLRNAGFIKVRKTKIYFPPLPCNVVTIHDYLSVHHFDRGEFTLPNARNYMYVYNLVSGPQIRAALRFGLRLVYIYLRLWRINI